MLASDKPAGPELDLTLAGLELYAELEARLGDEARIRRKGALIVHPEAATWAAEPARVAAAGVPGARLLGPDEVRAMEPALTGPVHGASFYPGDLQCDPRAIARALAREAAGAGATVRTDCRSRPWPATACAWLGRAGRRRGRGDRRRSVERGAGRGGGGAAPARAAQGPARPARRARARPRPPQGRGRVLLASVGSPEAGLQLSTVVETTFAGDVLVGSSRERRGFDTAVDPAVSAAMVARAARLFPVLETLPVGDAWAGLRPWLPDHLPAIGPSRRVPGVWLATGHEGAGVALGPVTGRLVAQLVTGEAPVVDPAPFDPDRFG